MRPPTEAAFRDLQILFLLSVMMMASRPVAMGRVPSMLTMTTSVYPNDIPAVSRSDLF